MPHLLLEGRYLSVPLPLGRPAGRLDDPPLGDQPIGHFFRVEAATEVAQSAVADFTGHRPQRLVLGKVHDPLGQEDHAEANGPVHHLVGLEVQV